MVLGSCPRVILYLALYAAIVLPGLIRCYRLTWPYTLLSSYLALYAAIVLPGLIRCYRLTWPCTLLSSYLALYAAIVLPGLVRCYRLEYVLVCVSSFRAKHLQLHLNVKGENTRKRHSTRVSEGDDRVLGGGGRVRCLDLYLLRSDHQH
jgi:hypothetical protein